MIEVDRLCRKMIRAEESTAPDDRVDRLRSAVLKAASAAGQRAERSSRFPLLVWAAAVGACAAIAMLAFWLGRPLTARVAGRSQRISAGDWVAAPEMADVPVWFSDGTVLDLGRSTQLLVASLGVRGAEVVVPNGRVHLAVVHRPYTRWLLGMGPYQVRVTGTSFSAAFDAVSGELVIAMDEGSVLVSGGCLERAAPVMRGQTFRTRCAVDAGAPPAAASHPAIRAAPADPAAPGPSDEASPSSPPDSTSLGVGLAQGAGRVSDSAPGQVLPGAASKRTVAEPAAKTAAYEWKALAAKGRYAESLAALDSPFPEFCERASSGDVLRVAIVARQLGQTARAEEALLAVRRRFPGTVDASIAAFDLGVLSCDARADFRRASVWFHRYLDEAPSGALRREALGRLVEAGARAHDEGSAREAARRYVSEYPTGPHADLARSVLR